MDCTVHRILQAIILEWVAFAFSRRSFQPRDRTQVSCIAGGFFISWATREAPLKTLGVLYLKKREITSGSPVQPVNQFFSFNINKMLKYLWICLMIFSLIVYVKMLFLSSLSLVTSEKENIKITKLFQNQYL